MSKELLKNFIAAQKKSSQIDAIEIAMLSNKSYATKVFDGKPDSIATSFQTGIGLKIWKNKKWGFAYTEKISEEALQKTLALAQDHLIISEDDECDFPNPPEAPAHMTLPSFVIEDISIKDLLIKNFQLEEEIKKSHPQIQTLDHCGMSINADEFFLINSFGVSQSFCRCSADAYVSVLAQKNVTAQTINPSVKDSKVFIDDFDFASLKNEMYENVESRLDVTEPKTGQYTVVFHPEAGRTFFSRFESVFSAESVFHNLSLLKDKLHTKIGQESISLTDNALLGPAARPFDGEGSISRCTPLIENGVLKNYLSNTYYSKQLGIPHTANAYRSVKNHRGISASNFYLEAGKITEEELFHKIKNGILVIELTGASASPISGDFSYGAIGYEIVDGKKSGYLNNFTVAGNFFKVLQTVSEISNKVYFDSSSLWSCMGSPYFAVPNLSIGSSH